MLPGGASGHHAALPGAVLLAIGLFLVVWALEGFGLLGDSRETGVTTFPNGEGNRPVPRTGTPATTTGGGGPVKAA